MQLGFFLHMQLAVGGSAAAAGAGGGAAAGGGLAAALGPAALSRPILFATAFMLLFSVVIALFKDIPDVAGDRKVRWAVGRGVWVVCRWAGALRRRAWGAQVDGSPSAAAAPASSCFSGAPAAPAPALATQPPSPTRAPPPAHCRNTCRRPATQGGVNTLSVRLGPRRVFWACIALLELAYLGECLNCGAIQACSSGAAAQARLPAVRAGGPVSTGWW